MLDEADHLADLGFLPAVKRHPRPDPRARSAPAVLGHARQGASTPLVRRYLDQPGHPLGRLRRRRSPPDLEHHAFTVAPGDKAAVVRELASGRERSLLFTRTKHAAKKLAGNSDRRAASPPSTCTATCRSRSGSATWPPSPTARLGCWSPPTSPLGASTSTTSPSSSTSTRRPSTRPTFTARAARPAPGASGAVVTLILPDQAREVASMIRQAGIRPTPARVAPGGATNRRPHRPAGRPRDVRRPRAASACRPPVAPIRPPTRPKPTSLVIRYGVLHSISSAYRMARQPGGGLSLRQLAQVVTLPARTKGQTSEPAEGQETDR